MYPDGGPAHPAIDRVRDQAVGGEEVSTAVHHANLPAARQLPCPRRFLNTGAKAAACERECLSGDRFLNLATLCQFG